MNQGLLLSVAEGGGQGGRGGAAACEAEGRLPWLRGVMMHNDHISFRRIISTKIAILPRCWEAFSSTVKW